MKGHGVRRTRNQGRKTKYGRFIVPVIIHAMVIINPERSLFQKTLPVIITQMTKETGDNN